MQTTAKPLLAKTKMKSLRGTLDRGLSSVLFEEHSGVGGLYFVTTNMICAFILTITLQLSWTSQVVAMADNFAYITSLNTAAYSYVGGEPAYTTTNPAIYIDSADTYYRPLSDFNKMLADSGIRTSPVTTCLVTWDGRRATVEFGEFNTILNVNVRSHRQEAIIETY